MELPSLPEIAAGYRPVMVRVRWASGLAAAAGFGTALPAACLLLSLPWALVCAVGGAVGGALLVRWRLIPRGSERWARYRMATDDLWLDSHYRRLQQFAAQRGDRPEAERMLWILVAHGDEVAYRDLLRLLTIREDLDGMEAVRTVLLRAYRKDPAAVALRQDEADQRALLPLLVETVPETGPWPLIHLAHLHQRLGDDRSAVAAWRRALQIAARDILSLPDHTSRTIMERSYRKNLPDNVEPLIILLVRQGRWSEAQAVALARKRREDPRARIASAALRRPVE